VCFFCCVCFVFVVFCGGCSSFSVGVFVFVFFFLVFLLFFGWGFVFFLGLFFQNSMSVQCGMESLLGFLYVTHLWTAPPL